MVSDWLNRSFNNYNRSLNSYEKELPSQGSVFETCLNTNY